MSVRPSLKITELIGFYSLRNIPTEYWSCGGFRLFFGEWDTLEASGEAALINKL